MSPLEKGERVSMWVAAPKGALWEGIELNDSIFILHFASLHSVLFDTDYYDLILLDAAHLRRIVCLNAVLTLSETRIERFRLRRRRGSFNAAHLFLDTVPIAIGIYDFL
jgi:hypothetical protein